MNRIVFSEGLNGADKDCKDKKSMGTINGMKQKNGRPHGERPFLLVSASLKRVTC
jgi:hypothetical protein